MFTLNKVVRFEAAHHLPLHDGLCRRPHGHSFVATLTLESETLCASGSSTDMVQDFKEVSAAVKPLLEEKLDHRDLNESLPLANPTSEAVARWMYEELKPKLPLLVAVTLEETCTSRCEYRPFKK